MWQSERCVCGSLREGVWQFEMGVWQSERGVCGSLRDVCVAV